MYTIILSHISIHHLKHIAVQVRSLDKYIHLPLNFWTNHYKDMPIDMFLRWLEFSSDVGDSREISGKALIRYFELDKLLNK